MPKKLRKFRTRNLANFLENSLSYKNAFKVILTAELFSNHSFFIREKPVKKLAVRWPKLLRNLRAGTRGESVHNFGTRFLRL